jgi:hypothetical protein
MELTFNSYLTNYGQNASFWTFLKLFGLLFKVLAACRYPEKLSKTRFFENGFFLKI